jgi:hypothetical protein
MDGSAEGGGMSDPTTVPDLLAAYMERHLTADGFDGLYHDSMECGCKIGDLMPCGAPDPRCGPGYLQALTGEQIADGYDFAIGPDKPLTPDELEKAGQLALFEGDGCILECSGDLDNAWPDALERVDIGAKP